METSVPMSSDHNQHKRPYYGGSEASTADVNQMRNQHVMITPGGPEEGPFNNAVKMDKVNDLEAKKSNTYDAKDIDNLVVPVDRVTKQEKMQG